MGEINKKFGFYGTMKNFFDSKAKTKNKIGYDTQNLGIVAIYCKNI